MLPIELPSTWTTSSPKGTIQATKEVDLGKIATGVRRLLGCIADSTIGTTAISDTSSVDRTSEEGEDKVGRVQIVDNFFADLDRLFKRRK